MQNLSHAFVCFGSLFSDGAQCFFLIKNYSGSESNEKPSSAHVSIELVSFLLDLPEKDASRKNEHPQDGVLSSPNTQSDQRNNDYHWRRNQETLHKSFCDFMNFVIK